MTDSTRLADVRSRLRELEREQLNLQTRYAGTPAWTASRIRELFSDNDVAREKVREEIARLERQ